MSGREGSTTVNKSDGVALTRFITYFEQSMIVGGGALALAVSIGLFISLLIRPTAGINLLNMATLLLASTAGIGLILSPNSPKWLVVASLCLLCAVIPTVFGAVFLLYGAPITLVVVGSGLKVFRGLAGIHAR